jgi:hypothetical protein
MLPSSSDWLALPINGVVTSTTNWASFSEIAFAFRVTPQLLLSGILFAVTMGIVGGFFPARRASKMPVIQGTGDDPEKLAANVRAMEECCLPLYRAGHLPVVGEWFALPLVQLAGSERIGDAPFNEIFHPIAERIVDHCDAIVRVGGPSQGADALVEYARANGKLVFASVDDVLRARLDR